MSKSLSVSQLNNYIKGMFFDEILLSAIEIYGEITEYTISGSNAYFTLKEGDCSISCIKFGAKEQFPIGTKVLLFGSVNFYEKGGRLSFNVKSIKPFGDGEQFVRLQKLKLKLEEEGLFSIGLPLPKVIKKVAIITSLNGAVIHDFLSVLKDRQKVDVYIFGVKVQGEKADKEIIDALKSINLQSNKFDCVVIARGGGGNDDLDTFNSENLAREVATSKVPIISAIGHEVDYTLCDLCAGTRAGTPSIAAEIIAASLDELYYNVNRLISSLNKSILSLYNKNELKLYKVENKISSNTQLKVAVCYSEVQHLKDKLESKINSLYSSYYENIINDAHLISANVNNILNIKMQSYSETEKSLQNSNPLKILSKGYAKVTKNNIAINSAKEVNSGEYLNIIFYDGIVDVIVNNKKILGGDK